MGLFDRWKRKGLPGNVQVANGNIIVDPNSPGRQSDVMRYATSDDVFAVVSLLATNAATIPMQVMVNGKPKPDHDLQVLLNRGNGLMGERWMEWAYSWLLLEGESLILVRKESTGSFKGLPSALYPTPSSQWTIESKDGYEVEYRYGASERKSEVPRDQVVHAYSFNPSNPLRGLSPLSSLRNTLDAEAAATQANASLFSNGLVADSVISAPNLNEVQRRELQAMVRKNHTGAHNRGSIIFTTSDVKIEKLSISPKDAEYIELQKFTTRDVAKVYRVPPMFLGDLEHATYSNYDQAWVSLWGLAIVPLVRMLVSALNATLSGQYQDEPQIVADLSEVPSSQDTKTEMQESQRGYYQSLNLQALVNAGMEYNAALTMVYGEDETSQ